MFIIAPARSAVRCAETGRLRTLMKIVVCVKQVPDTETRIRIAADGKRIVESRRHLDRSRPTTSSPSRRPCGSRRRRAARWCWCRWAPTASSPPCAAGLAMGADSAVHLKDPLFDATDTLGTARALAAAIRPLAARPRPHGAAGVGGDHCQMPGPAGRDPGSAAGDHGGQGRDRRRQGHGGARDRRRARGRGRPAAGRDLGPEGPQRAALREPQGHHGREEEARRGQGRRGPRSLGGGPGAQDEGHRPRAAAGAARR